MPLLLPEIICPRGVPRETATKGRATNGIATNGIATNGIAGCGQIADVEVEGPNREAGQYTEEGRAPFVDASHWSRFSFEAHPPATQSKTDRPLNFK